MKTKRLVCQNSHTQVGRSEPPNDTLTQVFHAAFWKSAWINQFLTRGAAEWTNLIDADIEVPVWLSSWWERLAINDLVNEAFLYGAAGRSVLNADSPPAPDGISEAYLQTHRSIVGYFNLFYHDPGSGPWYPPSDPARIEHDDWRFYRLFGPERCKVLPVAVGHLGTPGQNWGGWQDPLRVTPGDVNSEVGPIDSGAFAPPTESQLPGQGCVLAVGTVLNDALGPWAGSVGSVEWHPGSDFEYTSGPHARHIPDGVHIHPGPDAELLRVARRWKFEQIEATLPGRSGWLSWAGSCWTAEAEKPREGAGLDALLLWGEVSLSWLLEVLPNELSRLSTGAAIFLTRYGPLAYPNWSQVVALVLGPVAPVENRTLWQLHSETDCDSDARSVKWPRPPFTFQAQRYWHLGEDISVPRRFFVRGQKQSPSPVMGIYFYHRGTNSEAAVLSLHALRQVDPECFVGMVHEGCDVVSLRIACARYDVDYFCVEPGEIVKVSHKRELAKRRGSSIRTGLLGSKQVRISELTQQAAQRAVTSWLPSADVIWWEVGQLSESLKPAPERHASRHSVVDPVFLATRGHTEQEILAAWAPLVRVGSDLTVIIPLTPSDMATFQKNWCATRWPRDTPLLFALGGMDSIMVAEIRRMVERHPRVVIHEMSDSSLTSLPPGEPFWTAVLVEASTLVRTERWAYLDPLFHPSPGAELFSDPRFDSVDVGFPGHAFQRISADMGEVARQLLAEEARWQTGGVLKHMKLGPSATLWKTKTSREAISSWAGSGATVPFEIYFSAWARANGLTVTEVEFPRWGWKS